MACVELRERHGGYEKNDSGAHEQRGLRIWQNIVEEKKYDNMEGKMRGGKETFNSKLMSFSHQ